MNAKSLHQQQKTWAEQSALLMRDLLPFLDPLIDQDELDPEVTDTLGMLLDAASRSADSAFLLLTFGRHWDAELVVRSVFEASIKFVYLVHSKNDVRFRHDEFAEHQFQIAMMKDDQKARDALESVPDASGSEWDALRELVLPDAERDKLRAIYDKASRRSMETRWGYTGLLNALIRSGDPTYSTLSGLFYGYTLSSHLHHADYAGISIALGHSRLDPRTRDSTQLSRMSRLIRDCFTCFELRFAAASRFAGWPREDVSKVRQRIDELWAEMTASNSAWLKRAHANSP
jgi:hypothetical protein